MLYKTFFFLFWDISHIQKCFYKTMNFWIMLTFTKRILAIMYLPSLVKTILKNLIIIILYNTNSERCFKVFSSPNLWLSSSIGSETAASTIRFQTVHTFYVSLVGRLICTQSNEIQATKCEDFPGDCRLGRITQANSQLICLHTVNQGSKV